MFQRICTRAQVQAAVRASPVAQQFAQTKYQGKTVSLKAGQNWFADLIYMFRSHKPEINRNNKYILLVVDAFTRRAYGRALPDKTPGLVAAALESIWQAHPPGGAETVPKPATIATDRGVEFTADEFKDLMDANGVILIL